MVYTYYLFSLFRTQAFHAQTSLLSSQKQQITNLVVSLKEMIEILPIGIIQTKVSDNSILYENKWILPNFANANQFLLVNSEHSNSGKHNLRYKEKLYSVDSFEIKVVY